MKRYKPWIWLNFKYFLNDITPKSNTTESVFLSPLLINKGSLYCDSPVTSPAGRQRSECAEKAKCSIRHGSINTENKGFAPSILIQYGCETCFGVQTYHQDEKHVSIQQKCFRHFLSASKQVSNQVRSVPILFSCGNCCLDFLGIHHSIHFVVTGSVCFTVYSHLATASVM